MGMWPVPPQDLCLGGPMSGLTLCCHCLEILNHSEQGAPQSHSVVGVAVCAAGSAQAHPSPTILGAWEVVTIGGAWRPPIAGLEGEPSHQGGLSPVSKLVSFNLRNFSKMRSHILFITGLHIYEVLSPCQILCRPDLRALLVSPLPG